MYMLGAGAEPTANLQAMAQRRGFENAEAQARAMATIKQAKIEAASRMQALGLTQQNEEANRALERYRIDGSQASLREARLQALGLHKDDAAQQLSMHDSDAAQRERQFTAGQDQTKAFHLDDVGDRAAARDQQARFHGDDTDYRNRALAQTGDLQGAEIGLRKLTTLANPDVNDYLEEHPEANPSPAPVPKSVLNPFEQTIGSDPMKAFGGDAPSTRPNPVPAGVDPNKPPSWAQPKAASPLDDEKMTWRQSTDPDDFYHYMPLSPDEPKGDDIYKAVHAVNVARNGKFPGEGSPSDADYTPLALPIPDWAKKRWGQATTAPTSGPDSPPAGGAARSALATFAQGASDLYPKQGGSQEFLRRKAAIDEGSQDAVYGNPARYSHEPSSIQVTPGGAPFDGSNGIIDMLGPIGKPIGDAMDAVGKRINAPIGNAFINASGWNVNDARKAAIDKARSEMPWRSNVAPTSGPDTKIDPAQMRAAVTPQEWGSPAPSAPSAPNLSTIMQDAAPPAASAGTYTLSPADKYLVRHNQPTQARQSKQDALYDLDLKSKQAQYDESQGIIAPGKLALQDKAMHARGTAIAQQNYNRYRMDGASPVDAKTRAIMDANQHPELAGVPGFTGLDPAKVNLQEPFIDTSPGALGTRFNQLTGKPMADYIAGEEHNVADQYNAKLGNWWRHYASIGQKLNPIGFALNAAGLNLGEIGGPSHLDTEGSVLARAKAQQYIRQSPAEAQMIERMKALGLSQQEIDKALTLTKIPTY